MIKNDEFCAELIVEENNYADNEPVVTLRSPDNFKEVRSRIKGGSLKSARKRERSGFSINSKAILAIAALFLAVYVGVTAFEHLRKTPVHISNINEKSNNDITVQNPNNESGKKQNTVNNDTSNSKASEGKKVNQTNGTDKINTDSSKKQEQSNVQVKQSEESGANKTETDTENNNTQTNTANPENTSPDSTPDNSDTQNQNESPVEQQTNVPENKDTQTGLAE